MEEFANIDVPTFWRVIGVRAIGVAVVAASGSAGPAGFIALSATHVSASPPLILVSIDQNTSALQTVLEAGHFSVNYLASEQQYLVPVFSGKTELAGAQRFDTAKWTTLKTGAPVLVGAAGALDCALEETLQRYNAIIAIGRLVDFTSADQIAPLVSYRNRYL